MFTGIREGQSSPYREEFEKKVADLIAEVRNVYHGKLIMNGSTFDYRFPGLADPIGVTTDDTWHLDLLPDTRGENLQARRLEGFFQVLESRPWVAGTISWTYPMIDAPGENGDFARARLTETILAKRYGRYTGQ